MKRLTILLPMLLFFCGCSREVSPVSVLTLDRTDNGYRLTAEVVRQDSPEETAAPSYLSSTGPDLNVLLQSLETLLPDELYLSHAQVLLLSEEAARQSILPLADYLCADNDVRLSLRVAIVRDSTADELLQANDEVFALSELLDRAADAGTLPDMPLYRVAEALHANGTAILPALRLDEFNQTAPAGTAVFAGERLTCFLDGSEIGGGQNA